MSTISALITREIGMHGGLLQQPRRRSVWEALKYHHHVLSKFSLTDILKLSNERFIVLMSYYLLTLQSIAGYCGISCFKLLYTL